MIFLLPSRVVRDFGAVIRVEMIEVFDGWHDHAMGRIIAFEFIGHHPTGLMKQKELESSSRNVEALYLSQNIGELFTSAVRQELAFSAYHVQPGEARVVSSTVEHFFLDYVGAVEQRLEILAPFKVDRTDAEVFTSVCRSNLQQSVD